MGPLGRHWRIALHLLIVKTNLFFSSEPPNLLPLNFGQEVMDEGSFAQVSCIVTKGDQPLTISWSFHGHDISSDLGIITTPLGKMGSSLMITSVGHKHRGTFTCKASNQAGNTTQSVELRVNGALSGCWSQEATGFLHQPPVSVSMPECFDRSYNSSWSSCRTTACLHPCRHHFDARPGPALQTPPSGLVGH